MKSYEYFGFGNLIYAITVLVLFTDEGEDDADDRKVSADADERR